MLQPRDPTRRRSRIVRWVLLGVAVLVLVPALVATVFVASLGRTFDSARHTIPDPFPTPRAPKPTTGPAADAVNLLLLGYDVDAVDPETPQFVGKRQADTLMVVHIPADRRHVYVMSILRNSLVPVVGHGQQAVNAALALGGVRLQVQTVERLLGVRMDHVISASLVGTRGLTDALGGITVRNPSAFSQDGYAFQPGVVRLDGKRALAYIRGGSNSADGDITRARAQSAYVRGMLDDVFQAKTLLNPGALATSVSVLSPYLAVDQHFDSAYVAGLGLSLRGIGSADIRTFALPAPTMRRMGRANVLELDRAALAQVRRDLKNDSLDQYVH